MEVLIYQKFSFHLSKFQMKNKSIGINQRIPLDALHASLDAYLDDIYSYDYVLEQLQLEFKGENRLRKAVRIINKIISKNPEIDFINQNREEIKNALQKQNDRNIILISLLNISYPFSFSVLNAFGRYFKVQNIVNTEIIKKNVSSVYGGNRATENGIYSVIPMLLEARFFERVKKGLYEFDTSIVTSYDITEQLFYKSFKVNSLQDLETNKFSEPYFIFIKN